MKIMMARRRKSLVVDNTCARMIISFQLINGLIVVIELLSVNNSKITL
jgi:hypothetical protein